ncbi:MAG: hypothetical protein ACYDBZ_16500 [Steroidobacteraceae bacterium]
MSDPKDVSRPRTPLTLSPKTPRPATPLDEMASRMYGGTSTPHSAVALARALSEGVDPTNSEQPHSALEAARLATPSTVLRDDFEILREPTAGPGMAMFGLGGQGRRLNEILGQSPAADFGGPSEKYQRFTLKRDRDRPLAFDGRIVAEAEEKQFADQVVIRAAIYETQGGKFVTEMTRREVNPPANYGVGKRPFLFAKATVFESLDIAAMSFRTHGGRLTEELLRQIGDVDPEFIE